jgi:hypothetical protein
LPGVANTGVISDLSFAGDLHGNTPTGKCNTERSRRRYVQGGEVFTIGKEQLALHDTSAPTRVRVS